MLIKEQILDHEDDDKLIIKRTYDTSGTRALAKHLSETSAPMSDSVPVGVIPGWLLTLWLQEAGVSWDDDARDDVIRRKLMSGEYNALRPWQGTF